MVARTVQVLPGLAAIGADIVLENSDNPAAQQLAERAKRAIDPKFLDPADPETQMPRLQAENDQLKQLVEKAHQAVTAMADTIRTEELSNTVKKGSRDDPGERPARQSRCYPGERTRSGMVDYRGMVRDSSSYRRA